MSILKSDYERGYADGKQAEREGSLGAEVMDLILDVSFGGEYAEGFNAGREAAKNEDND